MPLVNPPPFRVLIGLIFGGMTSQQLRVELRSLVAPRVEDVSL